VGTNGISNQCYWGRMGWYNKRNTAGNRNLFVDVGMRGQQWKIDQTKRNNYPGQVKIFNEKEENFL
jgi:hypothetical protein